MSRTRWTGWKCPEVGDHEEVMERLNWCVPALKQLLQHYPALGNLSQPYPNMKETRMRRRRRRRSLMKYEQPNHPSQYVGHRRQAIANGRLRCADCGFDYGATGRRFRRYTIRQPE